MPKNVSQSNWGGYSVSGSPFTGVSGQWTQPNGSCANPTDGIAGIWVGIDGADSESVEQLGTTFACDKGTPTQLAWYEFFPAPPVYLSTTTRPVVSGDVIKASVINNANTFTLSMTNTSTAHASWSFTVSAKVAGAPASSAEWIVEAPSTNDAGDTSPLANFGTVSFTDCSATLNGKTSSITGFTPTRSIMTTKDGKIEANTNGLSADGTSFSLSYRS